ncbi:Zinc finger FYVE domain protein [Hirschfeldia incana]|nr:Zinc finger FYVE domain protein [Hirschfeldia incana]
MSFNRGSLTTKTYSTISSCVGLKQFMYGNTFTALDALWSSLCNLFFLLLSSIFRARSDKETSLVVVKTHNKRCDYLSDKSITCYVEEPKPVCFVFHDYYSSAAVQEEEMKMLAFTDEAVLVEKPFVVEKTSLSEGCFVKEHVKEEMLVYEFMRSGVLKGLLAHESFAGVEDNLFDEEEDEFIELNPSFQISNIAYQEEELKMGFDEEQEAYDFDDGDDDSDDDEYEHSDVIEKLKTEIRTARTGGLCTILEESETPLQELKPLKIEPKQDQFKDMIGEIHKVYKNYAVKMRKLDVIDSQTMHSISLLKLKDSSKPSRNIVKPRHKNVWPFKKHKLERDPIERLVKEASRDFETVYVSQLCLSWEMLRWQYTKLLESDSHVATTCQYNLVAGEFQLFQVLLQRFVENEPFQNSSRVETYLKNRRHFHNFLQIPLVRDDRSSKNNKKCRNEGEFAVKIEMLREIILESMRVFWEFLCADKDEFSSVMKVSHQTQVSPQDPLDLKLLTDMRTHLQKKEKKIKEILRSQCCIVKKLKKNESKSSSVRVKDELLIAQIELRVVSRVMTMSKLTTEKLVWCREKLDKMSFNGRKIHMEPSFSLLPC